MVVLIGDVDVAVPINRQPGRLAEAGVGAGPIIRPETGVPASVVTTPAWVILRIMWLLRSAT